MSNIYLKEPRLLTNTTEVRTARRFDSGETAVALAQNIVRPATGGQPCDHATLTIGADTFEAHRVFKADGETWISLEGVSAELPPAGEMAFVEVDPERRQRLSRCHTLTHLMMAAARHVLPGFDSKGASIHEDERTASIRFRATAKPTEKQICLIDALTRHFVLKNAPVTFWSVKSPQAGAEKFPKWRIDSELGLSGSIRVVEIRGIDANPCSGSHVAKTGEIGAYALKTPGTDGDDIMTINAELTADWMYWFGDEFLSGSADVDLNAFEQ